jgi:hypothetical protein
LEFSHLGVLAGALHLSCSIELGNGGALEIGLDFIPIFPGRPAFARSSLSYSCRTRISASARGRAEKQGGKSIPILDCFRHGASIRQPTIFQLNAKPLNGTAFSGPLFQINGEPL